MNEELIEKAKEAKSVEELIAMAKEKGIELTEEQAKEYFARLNPASGEMSDDELDAVAGGGCGKTSSATSLVGKYVHFLDGRGCSVCARKDATDPKWDFSCIDFKIEGVLSGIEGTADCVYQIKCGNCWTRFYASASELMVF